MVNHPRLYIPDSAQPTDQLAFADRDDFVQRLLADLVGVGNAVRGGNQGVHAKIAITGYMGVGKSALILRVLQLLRDPPPEVRLRDKERWVLLYFSGKNYASFDALADEIPKLVHEAEPSLLESDAVANLMRDLAEDIGSPATQASQLRWFHPLFKRDEANLFKQVKEAVQQVGEALSLVAQWQGAQVRKMMERSRSSQRDQSFSSGARSAAEYRAELSALSGGGGHAEAALNISAELLAKSGTQVRGSVSLEHSAKVSVNSIVDALNILFAKLRQARIPTFLVLDDLDDFASGTGASYRGRAAVLSAVLAELYRLRPNALVVGMRQEYKDQEIHRHFQMYRIPPMLPKEAREVLHAWATHPERPLPTDALVDLKAIGNKVLSILGEDERSVVAFQFLKLVSRLHNGGRSADLSARDLLGSFFSEEYSSSEVRALLEAVRLMPEDAEPRCLQGDELDPEPFSALSTLERRQLESSGLLRPALAGDDDNTNLVLDPLIAWAARANRRK